MLSDPKMLALVQDNRFGQATTYALINNVHEPLGVEVQINTDRIWLCDQDKPTQAAVLNDKATLDSLAEYGIKLEDLPKTTPEALTCVKRGDIMEEVYLTTTAWLQQLRDLAAKGEVQLVQGAGPRGELAKPIPDPIVFSLKSMTRGNTPRPVFSSAKTEAYFYDQSGVDKVRFEPQAVLPSKSMIIKFNYGLDRSFALTSQFPVQLEMYGKVPYIANKDSKNLAIFVESYKTAKLAVHDLFFSRGVLLHEIGHAFGLADTYVYGKTVDGEINHKGDGGRFGAQPESIMNGTYMNNLQFTTDDNAGLIWLYRFFVNKTLSDPASCPNNYRHDNITNGCLYDPEAQDDKKAAQCALVYGSYDRGACFCPALKNAAIKMDGSQLCLLDQNKIFSIQQMRTDRGAFGFHYVVCQRPESEFYHRVRQMKITIQASSKSAAIEMTLDDPTNRRGLSYTFTPALAEGLESFQSLEAKKDDLNNFVTYIDRFFGSGATNGTPSVRNCRTVFADSYNADTGLISP